MVPAAKNGASGANATNADRSICFIHADVLILSRFGGLRGQQAFISCSGNFSVVVEFYT
ncbi:hypothetical protein Hanom_Chr12g01166351 [Helianthus anomalus]